MPRSGWWQRTSSNPDADARACLEGASILRRRCIALTGAWGGGKTTLIQELSADPRYAGRYLVLPEAAPLVRRIGIDIQSEPFEIAVLRMQHALEAATIVVDDPADQRPVICHRGSLDALAFWQDQGRDPGRFFELGGTTLEAELNRYDAVLLLRTTAGDLPEKYEDYRQIQPRRPASAALQLEKYLEACWSAHPRFFAIGNSVPSWQEKSRLAKAVLEARLPDGGPCGLQEANVRLNRITYPSSQAYQLGSQGEFLPSPVAAARLGELQKVLPRQRWNTLIDIGCAKGMFLLWAVQNLGIKRATGLDVARDMVDACRLAVDASGAPVTILHGSPDRLYTLLAPAELVFVLHCYHYLYFGSKSGTTGIPSHDRWFQLFADITADTLIFANALAVKPEQMEAYRRLGLSEQELQDYCPEKILASASRYFRLQEYSLGRGRPYIVMRKQL